MKDAAGNIAVGKGTALCDQYNALGMKPLFIEAFSSATPNLLLCAFNAFYFSFKCASICLGLGSYKREFSELTMINYASFIIEWGEG